MIADSASAPRRTRVELRAETAAIAPSIVVVEPQVAAPPLAALPRKRRREAPPESIRAAPGEPAVEIMIVRVRTSTSSLFRMLRFEKCNGTSLQRLVCSKIGIPNCALQAHVLSPMLGSAVAVLGETVEARGETLLSALRDWDRFASEYLCGAQYHLIVSGLSEASLSSKVSDTRC